MLAFEAFYMTTKTIPATKSYLQRLWTYNSWTVNRWCSYWATIESIGFPVHGLQVQIPLQVASSNPTGGNFLLLEILLESQASHCSISPSLCGFRLISLNFVLNVLNYRNEHRENNNELQCRMEEWNQYTGHCVVLDCTGYCHWTHGRRRKNSTYLFWSSSTSYYPNSSLDYLVN